MVDVGLVLPASDVLKLVFRDSGQERIAVRVQYHRLRGGLYVDPDCIERYIFLTADDRLPEGVTAMFGCEDTIYFLNPDNSVGRKMHFDIQTEASKDQFESVRQDPDERVIRITAALRDHNHISCDGCRTTPIMNIRYKCQPADGCLDFDFCEECHARQHTDENFRVKQHTTRHTMIPLTRPIMQARWLISESLSQMVLNIFENYSIMPCVAQRTTQDAAVPGPWVNVTYHQFRDRMLALSSGLSKVVPRRSFVGIMAPNSVDWLVTDMACILRSYVSVPIHITFGAQQVTYIVNLCEMFCLVIGVPQLALALSVLPECKTLKYILLFGTPSTEDRRAAAAHGVSIIAIADAEAMGAAYPVRPVDTPGKEICSIVFTSGTTSTRPKGAPFTADQMASDWQRRVIPSVGAHSNAAILEFHPFAWLTGRDDFRMNAMLGGQMYIFQREIAYVFEDMQEVRPTKVKAVPSIFSRLYNEYEQMLAAAGKHPVFDDEGLPIFDKDVMNEFRARKFLGDRCAMIVMGGAKSTPAVKKFVTKAFKDSFVVDAYGTTEAGGITSDNSLLNIEYKLMDVPEMGYFANGNPRRGELWVKTDQMISGYFRDPEATAEKFIDGWFATGDIVEMVGGLCKVIDRKQHLFKLQDGEFVSPDLIERALEACPMLQQISAFGNAEHDCIVAVGVLSQSALVTWAAKNNRDLTTLDVATDPELMSHVMTSLQRLANEANLRPRLFPAAIHLTTTLFCPEDGTMTPTMKYSRAGIARKYATQLNALFSAGSARAKLASLLREVTEGEVDAEGSADKPLSALGLSSVAKIRLSKRLTEAFPQLREKASLEMVLADPTVDGLLGHMETGFKDALHSQDDAEAVTRDLELGRRLAKATVAPRRPLPPPEERIYLMTGTTGFLGVYLLVELMKQRPTSKFICLVRADGETKAKERQAHALSQALNRPVTAADLDAMRISVVSGDLDVAGLGLSEEDRVHASTAHVIYHCAALVNWVFPYSRMARPNAHATLELLEFALEKGMIFQHISTLGAGRGTSNELPVREQDGVPFLMGGYNTSKWMAEMYVNFAVEHCGLPANIFRPGMIVGNSETGHCHLSDFVPRMLAAVLQLKKFPAVHQGTMEMLPVDAVAGIIVTVAERSTEESAAGAGAGAGVAASTSAGMEGRRGIYTVGEARDAAAVYHVNNAVDELPSWGAIGEMLRAENPDLSPVSREEFIRAAETQPNSLVPLLDFVRRPGFFRPATHFETRRTCAWLSVDERATLFPRVAPALVTRMAAYSMKNSKL